MVINLPENISYISLQSVLGFCNQSGRHTSCAWYMAAFCGLPTAKRTTDNSLPPYEHVCVCECVCVISQPTKHFYNIYHYQPTARSESRQDCRLIENENAPNSCHATIRKPDTKNTSTLATLNKVVNWMVTIPFRAGLYLPN